LIQQFLQDILRTARADHAISSPKKSSSWDLVVHSDHAGNYSYHNTFHAKAYLMDMVVHHSNEVGGVAVSSIA
jgi:hypothetical protein